MTEDLKLFHEQVTQEGLQAVGWGDVTDVLHVNTLEVMRGATPFGRTGQVLLAAGTSAVGNIMNCGKLTQQHTQFSGLYADLAQQIGYTLTRRKRSREACDVSMSKYIHKHQLLGAAAPDL